MTVGFDQICAISLILFVVMGSLGFQKVMTQPENLDQIQCRVLELPSRRNGESNAYLLSVNFLWRFVWSSRRDKDKYVPVSQAPAP